MAALIQGDNAKGRRNLEETIAWAPHISSAYLILSQLTLDSGQTEEARRYLKQMMKAAPKDARGYIAYAELEAASGDINGARSILIRGSQRLPSNQAIIDAMQRFTPPRKP